MGKLSLFTKELLQIFLFNNLNYSAEQLQFRHTEFGNNPPKAK